MKKYFTFKSALLGLASLSILFFLLGSVVLPRIIETTIISSYEEQVKKEESMQFQTEIKVHTSLLFSLLSKWSVQSNLESLWEDEIEDWDSNLVRLGNLLSLQYGVVKIQSFDYDGKKLVDIKTSEVDVGFKKEEVDALVQKAKEKEATLVETMYSANGTPFLVAAYPLEDEDEEISYFNILFTSYSEMLNSLTSHTEYPNELLSGDVLIQGTEKIDHSQLENLGMLGAVKYKDAVYLPREILLPEGTFPRPTTLRVYAKFDSLYSTLSTLHNVMNGGAALLFLVFIAAYATFYLLNQKRLSTSLGILSQVSNHTLREGNTVCRQSLSLIKLADELRDHTAASSSAVVETKSMAESTKESAEACERLSRSSFEAAESGNEGISALKESIEGVENSNKEVLSAVKQNSEDLSKISLILQEIATDTEVINDIAFQTKLLSFNASVEAARAGDHGRGFSVVAEEIGSLAAMSSTAASEITNKISSRTKEIGETIVVADARIQKIVEDSQIKIHQTAKITEENGEILTTIVKLASEVEERVKEISGAANEQFTALTAISNAVESIEKSSDQVKENSESGQEAASILLDRSRELQIATASLENYFYTWKLSSKVTQQIQVGQSQNNDGDESELIEQEEDERFNDSAA